MGHRAHEHTPRNEQFSSLQDYSADEGLMTTEDVVAYLRLPSKQSLYALTHKKRIPHYRIEGRLRFKRPELREWMRGYKVPVSQNADDICKEVQL